MPLPDAGDTDMSDGLSEPLPAAPFHASAIPNGVRSTEQTPSLFNSGIGSRETSLPVKVASQLKLATPSSEEYDEEDGEEEGVDALRLSPQRPALPMSTLPTGLCYDARMRFHTELDPPKDHQDFHPEDPRRILEIFKTLCEAGLASDPQLSILPLVPQPLKMIPVRHATRHEVLLVHFEEHFEFLKNTASPSRLRSLLSLCRTDMPCSQD